MTTIILSLIGLAVGIASSTILTMIIENVGPWFNKVSNDMFFNAMCVEINFNDMNFNISGIYRAIYTFAIALLMMFFIKKMIETYMAWSNGDPETSPISVLIGFVKALIIMICFGYLYEVFVDVFYNLFQSIYNAAFPGGNQINNVNPAGMNLIGMFLYSVTLIFFGLIVLQNAGRGIEMFVLRLGLPFACIGLLNADGGAFKGYSQKMIKVAFTVVVQVLLINFAIALINGNHYVLALATANISYKTPGLLNEFMVTSGSGYYGAREAGSIAARGKIIAGGMLKGGK